MILGAAASLIASPTGTDPVNETWQLRPHPLRELVLEIGHCACEEHGVENPAEQKAGPCMQAGHALPDARACNSHIVVRIHAPALRQETDHASGNSATATMIKPAQAFSALRTAKTQMTAPA